MSELNRDIKIEGDYKYLGAGRWQNDYLVNPLIEIIKSFGFSDKRLFEVGFGNGWTANHLAQMGYQVSGIEPSDSGVAIAQRTYPSLNLQSGNAYQDLQAKFGTFSIVYSLEVIEHVQFPRKFARSVFNLLEPSGCAIISTPYHGYVKNLIIALLGKTDSHYDPLWDDGHIRFFSEATLTTLLLEAGFSKVEFKRAGRFGPIAKSMIAIAVK